MDSATCRRRRRALCSIGLRYDDALRLAPKVRRRARKDGAGEYGTFGLQLLRITIGVVQHDRIHFGFEAVPLRFAPGLQAEHADRHDIRTVQRHQRMRRRCGAM